MFNVNNKEDFLSNYENEGTKDTYRRIFIKSASTEQMLNKDLYKFSRDELENVLYDLNPLTPLASQTNGRIITAYITWAINNNKIKTINPLVTVSSSWFDKFVDKSVKIYFSKSEIELIEDYCENAQDAVIIRLYFEGLSGKEALELRYIKKQDVDYDNNKVYLSENPIQRKLFELSPRAMRTIREASKQKEYKKKNGEMEETENKNVRPYTDLVENDYVIRSSITKTDSFNSPIDKSVIYRRVSGIATLFPVPNFTPKNISRSGMIFMAKEILEEKRKHDKSATLEKEDYLKICERYDVNQWFSLKEFCNEKMIDKLYS